jgi:flagellar biosynthesis chaperone FliJ
MEKAEQAMLGDEALQTDLAIKESKKKQIPPLIIFRQDISKQVLAKTGALTALNLNGCPIEVILDSPEVIKNVPQDLDDGLLAEQIILTANYATLVSDVSAALKKADQEVAKDPKKLDAANKQFQADLLAACQAAADRGAAVVLKLVGVRASYRNYKLVAAGQLTLTIAGAVSGAIGLILTPFTAGASTIMGCIGLVKSSIAIGKQLADLASSAEEMGNGLAKDIQMLAARYNEAKSRKVGGIEMTVTLVNATLPTAFATIKSCKGDADTMSSKIDGIEVKSHDVSQTLGKTLNDQQAVIKNLSDWEAKSKASFTADEAKKIQKLIDQLEKSAPNVINLIAEVGKLHNRVQECRASHGDVKKALDKLAAKEPTWAQVGEILINVAAGIGFGVAGNVNAPDPYKFVKAVADVNQQIGNVVSSFDGLQSSVRDAVAVFQERAKKK